MAEIIQGAEGGSSILGTLGNLAAGGLNIYGQTVAAKNDAKSETRLLDAAKAISSNQTAAATTRTRSFLMVGAAGAMLLALFIITKRKFE